MTRILMMAALLAALAWQGPVLADERFESVKVLLERNVADKDAEIKFEATGGTVGLANLKVVAPDGRTVIDFKSPDAKLGMRTLSFESPEPPFGKVQADFPEGLYAFTSDTVSGGRIEGKATLSHAFPDVTTLAHPQPDAKNVAIKGLRISWRMVEGLDACVVVIEQEATGQTLKSTLPGKATFFMVPDGFLLPHTEYKLAIGTVAKNGNTSFIETDFTTAKR